MIYILIQASSEGVFLKLKQPCLIARDIVIKQRKFTFMIVTTLLLCLLNVHDLFIFFQVSAANLVQNVAVGCFTQSFASKLYLFISNEWTNFSKRKIPVD